MERIDYTIIEMTKGGWMLTIYGNSSGSLVWKRSFNRYIEALEVVQMLQLNLTENDKRIAI